MAVSISGFCYYHGQNNSIAIPIEHLKETNNSIRKKIIFIINFG